MRPENELRSLSDEELLQSLDRVVVDSRRVEANVVAHIAEVDQRRLYEGQACASMFTYCTEVLQFAEHAAYMRIAAARAARRFPALLTMLEDGRLHVSGIAKLAPHLTVENCKTVLSRASHLSKRKIEELVAELSPKPDVGSTVRRLPQPEHEPDSSPAVELGPGRVVDGTKQLFGGSGANPATRPGPARIKPLAPERYRVQFTASATLREKLERLEALMKASEPEGDLADFIEVAVTEKLERLEARRFGRTTKPRKNASDSARRPKGRHLPVSTRRVVSERDGDRCTFISPDGRRCSETRALEFHHEQPYARGPDHSPENMRLVCKAHNMHLAERDFGKDWMSRYRRTDDRIREPHSIYGRSRLPDRLADAVVSSPRWG